MAVNGCQTINSDMANSSGLREAGADRSRQLWEGIGLILGPLSLLEDFSLSPQL